MGACSHTKPGLQHVEADKKATLYEWELNPEVLSSYSKGGVPKMAIFFVFLCVENMGKTLHLCTHSTDQMGMPCR